MSCGDGPRDSLHALALHRKYNEELIVFSMQTCQAEVMKKPNY